MTAGDENSTLVKSGGLLSRMRAQAAARTAKTINIPSAQATIPTPPTSPRPSLVDAVPEVAVSPSVGERVSNPGQSLAPLQQESSSADPPLQLLQPSCRLPVVVTTSTDVIFSGGVSDLSDPEHEEESARSSTPVKKPSARKGKQCSTGQGKAEGGPSKHKNTRKKGKNA